MKICIVSSCGGHLTEVRCLMPAYEQYEHFYVLNDYAELPSDMQGKTDFIVHSERDWKQLINLWEAFRILRRERPQVILSTGAGPARTGQVPSPCPPAPGTPTPCRAGRSPPGAGSTR